MSDIEYILPKTYNGKTVTELFPEFKYNSVCIYLEATSFFINNF